MTKLSVGIPKEIKKNEARVAITPDGVHELVSKNIEVFVESGAGVGASFYDIAYIDAGATMCDAKTAWAQDMLVKVKEPQESEFSYFRNDLILFTYLHLAAYPKVAQALCEKSVTSFGYETVNVNGQLPLLAPMSEIAGRLAIQVACRFLESPQGGRGILLSGSPGVAPAKVIVLGAGNVGINAALLASELGANVEIFDINLDRLRQIDLMFHGKIRTRASSYGSISNAIKEADAVIGAVLVPGGRAPVVVDEDMVKSMKPGSVLIDTAIDQGGCIATSRETSHDEPTFVLHDVIHYAVGNMPGAVSHTSTYALTNATLPFVVSLAVNGVDDAIAKTTGLSDGLNTRDGQIVNDVVRTTLS